MEFNLDHCIVNLRRTPVVIQALIHDLPRGWVTADEGEGTWSPKQIIAHMVVGEQSDWITRGEIILSDAENKEFEPFDMNAHYALAEQMGIREIRNEFSKLRSLNLATLTGWNLSPEQLKRTGIHPEFGEVTLQQLLATWVAHDLSHIAQISRVFAKQYKNEAGPWTQYLRILQS